MLDLLSWLCEIQGISIPLATVADNKEIKWHASK